VKNLSQKSLDCIREWALEHENEEGPAGLLATSFIDATAMCARMDEYQFENWETLFDARDLIGREIQRFVRVMKAREARLPETVDGAK
jgi:hypothetical protein